ncbi:hypothetical protein SNEBB_002721 [Seison nebaliae]|nr:hypothetical protein SNEBB_002721 [Seison nebaliae]
MIKLSDDQTSYHTTLSLKVMFSFILAGMSVIVVTLVMMNVIGLKLPSLLRKRRVQQLHEPESEIIEE